jgi:hypothetical protein
VSQASSSARLQGRCGAPRGRRDHCAPFTASWACSTDEIGHGDIGGRTVGSAWYSNASRTQQTLHTTNVAVGMSLVLGRRSTEQSPEHPSSSHRSLVLHGTNAFQHRPRQGRGTPHRPSKCTAATALTMWNVGCVVGYSPVAPVALIQRHSCDSSGSGGGSSTFGTWSSVEQTPRTVTACHCPTVPDAGCDAVPVNSAEVSFTSVDLLSIQLS